MLPDKILRPKNIFIITILYALLVKSVQFFTGKLPGTETAVYYTLLVIWFLLALMFVLQSKQIWKKRFRLSFSLLSGCALLATLLTFFPVSPMMPYLKMPENTTMMAVKAHNQSCRAYILLKKDRTFKAGHQCPENESVIGHYAMVNDTILFKSDKPGNPATPDYTYAVIAPADKDNKDSLILKLYQRLQDTIAVEYMIVRNNLHLKSSKL